ncbi:MAG TPA: carboxymuconolactone decarboxylase family protein [Solirubrobacterales bacterium]|jgi:alkylhydroperoxidase family enzyme|nr:carboxymuconolactone decarboxylase family protein [Solirubrobacterales bacterium]
MSPRVPKAEFDGPVEEMVERFGAVPEPIEVMWHNPAVAMAAAEFGAKAGEWNVADESLKSFAHMAVSAQVGCSWCLDFGYFMAQNQNLDLAKASKVPRWREATVFTPLERQVMAYAEAMTNTPPTVTDEMTEGLLEELGPKAMVELTAFIGFANFSTRSNVSLGIESQGFSADCEVPLASRSEAASPVAS